MRLKIILLLFSILLITCNNDITPPNDNTTNIYVLEKDHIFGGFGDVDNYHHTLVINTSDDTITFNVECPTPEGLKRESIRSPAFGRNAFIPTEFSKYFTIPNMANDYLTNEPDTITQESYFWNNLKLGSSDGIHVPYSSYLGEGEELFIKSFGVNNFMGLEVISEYKIEKDTSNSSYINIEIKQTMVNTTEENMNMVGVVLHVPRELNTKPDETNLYQLISDTVISSNKYDLDHDWGFGEGFGLYRSDGQTVTIVKDILMPNTSFEFIFKMTIEPLVDKFEIYPMYQIYFETNGERIWPQSIVTVDDKKYDGNVDYLKVCGLAIPTYILFSIDKEKLRVVSPEEVEPTFK
jgi:hypothetical protein